jgi:ABC-type nitrate/sulfonate/bicarbonate transport system permease component
VKSLIQSIASITVFVVGWELIARSGWISVALFPPPSAVIRALAEWAQSGDLARDLVSSLWRVYTGLAIGVLAGVLFGVTAGQFAWLRNTIVPIVNLFRPIPPVAMIPLVIVWAGIGNGSKVLSTAFACFFPMFTAAYQGAVNVPDSYLWAARSAGLSKLAILARIVFPATLNVCIAGLRVTIAVAFVMCFVSELAGSSQGLGYRISLMNLNYRIDHMIAAMFVLAACAALTDAFFVRIIIHACPWIGKDREV